MNSQFLIPEYMQNFSCIGAKCEDTCCAGWKVTVDKNTYKKYKNVKVPVLKDLLKKNISRERSNPTDGNYAKIKMDEKGRCNFLTSEGWCKIHSELGADFLCNTCSVYPRMYNLVDERIEVSLTPTCPEALRNILLNPKGIDFLVVDDFQNKGALMKIISNKNNPDFWELRSFTIRLLQNREQSIEVRLIVLGLFFSKISALSVKEQNQQMNQLMAQYEAMLHDQEQIVQLLQLPSNISFQIDMIRSLLNYRISGGVTNPRYLECVQEVIESLKLENSEGMDSTLVAYKNNSVLYDHFVEGQSYLLENYLVNTVFKDTFPLNYNNYFESYVMLVVNFCMIKLHLIGMVGNKEKLTTERVIKLIQSYSKEVEHNSLYLNNVRNLLKDSGYTTMAHMIVLLKS